VQRQKALRSGDLSVVWMGRGRRRLCQSELAIVASRPSYMHVKCALVLIATTVSESQRDVNGEVERGAPEVA
jgi:hypothetical protein